MPILDIEIVANNSSQEPTAELTQSLADTAAKVFGIPRGTVWGKLRIIPPWQYAEDHGKPDSVSPVFDSILKPRIPDSNTIETEISQLTQALANTLNFPAENIHILYQPDAEGRVAFGGRVVR